MMATAFLLGFAGSLHCVGMCSPLAMAVTRMSRHALVSKALYNGGRIFTYSVMGVVAGAIGGIFDLLAIQKFFSIFVGAGLVIFGISGFRSFNIPLVTPLMFRATEAVKKLFGALMKKKSNATVLVLGVSNGLLPCGLSYMAVAYSMTATGSAQGFLYMLLFGAGTLPAMVLPQLALKPLVARFNLSLPKINAAILIFVGLLLVARNFVHFPMGHELPAAPVSETICR